MKNYLIIILLFVIHFINASSQTPNEIIDKYLTAIGGSDNLESLKSGKFTGTFSGGDINSKWNDSPFEIYFNKPSKVLVVTKIPEDKFIKRGCDGTKGWLQNPFSEMGEVKILGETETNSMKKMVDFEGELVNYKTYGSSVEYMGYVIIEKKFAHIIKLTNKAGTNVNYYLDTASFLLLKTMGTTSISGVTVTAETYYNDYKSEEGYLMPHLIEVFIILPNKVVSTKMNIEKADFHAYVDDKIFNIPKK